MKKKTLLAAAVLAALAVPQVAGAEGFGIVEWSAQGTAMQGARMFAENDASMVAYNPASITKVENGAAAIHVTRISPHGKYDAESNPIGQALGLPAKESGHNRISPGLVPGLYYVKKVASNDWFGIGTYTRYGMISEFYKGSIPGYSATKSKMDGISITPTYAHKFDKKWTAAAGVELNYVKLTMERQALVPTPTDFRVKGDTWAIGWNAAVNYSFDEKNEIGLVYHSKISQNMKNADLDFAPLNGYGIDKTSGKVVLPDTWSIGYGHKFDDRFRMELNAMRVNWHTYSSLNMDNLPAQPKNWKDGWRYAVGLEYKLSSKYNLLAGYSYDGSCIPAEYADFMVPTGNRKTLSIGAEYHDKKQDVAFTVGYMKIGDQNIGIAAADGTKVAQAHTHSNFAPIFSIGYQYKF